LRFSAVYRVGGSKSLPLFTPETGGGHARKIAVSNGVMKYSAGFIGITEERNQSYGDASADWKHRFVCTASTILEDTLKEKILEAINVAVSGKNSFLAILKKNIETVLSEDLDETTADIDKRLEELQTELIQKANSKEAYDNIVNEIYRLRDLRQETLSRNALRQDKRIGLLR